MGKSISFSGGASAAKVKDNASECKEASCKSSPKKFGFCELHFKHFKFGALKKNGLKATDFEKKIADFERGNK